jgi:hypothetical protein
MTISKAMSLAVQSATGMRFGDLARANGHNDREVTTSGDLIVDVVKDEEGIHVRASLTLRYAKGHKYVFQIDQKSNPERSTKGTT